MYRLVIVVCTFCMSLVVFGTLGLVVSHWLEGSTGLWIATLLSVALVAFWPVILYTAWQCIKE